MSDTPLRGKHLAVIGCGNMASAVVGGLLNQRLMTPDHIRGSDPDPERRAAFSRTHGVETLDSNTAVIQVADIVLLAVKPQSAVQVLEEVGVHITAKQMVISIMAGISTHFIESRIAAPIPTVRVMPNTPALIGCGAAAIAPGKFAKGEHLALARAIFEAVGICEEVEEHALDAVTGLSGSGPGYIYYFVEALIQAGVDVGLNDEVSQTLVRQTLIGSARLLGDDPEQRSPADLRKAVTSPGGTTAAGLEVLGREKVAEAIRAAVKAATERSRELGRS